MHMHMWQSVVTEMNVNRGLLLRGMKPGPEAKFMSGPSQTNGPRRTRSELDCRGLQGRGKPLQIVSRSLSKIET